MRRLALAILMVAGLMAAGLVAAGAAAPAARAVTLDAPPDGVYAYTLEHSEHGKLGEHVVTISTDGDERHVQVERHIRVERVWITVYREDTRTEELWRDRDLVRFWRQTVKDGKTNELTIDTRNGWLVFADSGHSTGLPLGTFPTNPWNPGIVEQTVLMDTDDGRPVHVKTRPAGEEQLTVGGVAVTAQRFEMEGEDRRTLWYDGLGRLVRQQIHNDSGIVTFTLQKLPDPS